MTSSVSAKIGELTRYYGDDGNPVFAFKKAFDKEFSLSYRRKLGDFPFKA